MCLRGEELDVRAVHDGVGEYTGCLGVHCRLFEVVFLLPSREQPVYNDKYNGPDEECACERGVPKEKDAEDDRGDDGERDYVE